MEASSATISRSGVGPASLPQRAAGAEALAHLEPDARALLWLREVEGYSYAELAEILNIPMGTVKSRLFSAREEFRRVWRGA